MCVHLYLREVPSRTLRIFEFCFFARLPLFPQNTRQMLLLKKGDGAVVRAFKCTLMHDLPCVLNIYELS